MIHEEERLQKRVAELRERLELMSTLEKIGQVDARRRAKFGAKLAHLERRLFSLRQGRLKL